MSTDLNRRKWMTHASATLALLPVFFFSRPVGAKTNSPLRAEFKYQSTPRENMSCTTCLEFIPGKTDKDLGGCKVLPGDDEIEPNGYCTRWNTM
jgi:hypothetical protein